MLISPSLLYCNCTAVFANIMQTQCDGQFFPQSVFFPTGVTVSFFPSQFFSRGKNRPAHSFPGEKTD